MLLLQFQQIMSSSTAAGAVDDAATRAAVTGWLGFVIVVVTAALVVSRPLADYFVVG
jgi:hypothetical protein